ncbi:DUF2312 domain-containing protein [Azospirillum brasilense]|nr:DUF2312 domain-containing protein [Azospirillum brasilense]
MFVERIERMEEERIHLARNDDKRHLQTEIQAIYTEAEHAGFDRTVLKEIIRLRKTMTEEQRILIIHYLEAANSEY